MRLTVKNITISGVLAVVGLTSTGFLSYTELVADDREMQTRIELNEIKNGERYTQLIEGQRQMMQMLMDQANKSNGSEPP